MAFQVRLQPSGHSFTVEPGQKILEAGLAAGLAMPYSCRSGVCRTCIGRRVCNDAAHYTRIKGLAFLIFNV